MDHDNPFMVPDRLRDLFGTHPGSEIGSRLTYIPVGTCERLYHSYLPEQYLRLEGSQIFDAEQYDYMTAWMSRYEPRARWEVR